MNACRCRTRSKLAFLAAVAAGALVAGCGDDDDEDTKPTAAGPTPFAIQIEATGKNQLALTHPATVKAGLVRLTLRNIDKRPHSAQIARIVGNRTVDDVLKAVNAEAENAPIPTWIEDGGGIGTVAPDANGSVTQVLKPGRYAIWDDEGGEDDGPRNSDIGGKGEFTVTGPAVDAELPGQPGTVTATDDGKDEYSFEVRDLKAGANQVRFENTGKELHHAIFFPLRKGATFDQADAMFREGEEPKGPPPVDFEKGVSTAVIDGGIAQTLELDLPAGEYALVCFVGDRKGSKPHVEQGMIASVTVK